MKTPPSYNAIIQSPIGHLGITLNQQKLSHISFLPNTTNLKAPQDPETQHIAHELNCYFNNPKHIFTITTLINVTPFQQKLLKALQQIPNGSTQTYGQLAKNLQSSPRAIGQACRNNPLPILIPCHRVVAAKHLGGFSGEKQGAMLEIKQWLLKHETPR